MAPIRTMEASSPEGRLPQLPEASLDSPRCDASTSGLPNKRTNLLGNLPSQVLLEKLNLSPSPYRPSDLVHPLAKKREIVDQGAGSKRKAPQTQSRLAAKH